ncbi:hypothetical protein C8F04DRAFT_1324012 [Mycena alexandri]|uniref:Uncharacterized protein n=1 Tax=Mycena alexandri TaxID=1745969 RepID=A0AAD6S110_9AGAR|nr:hypothetical protein C8F04DRAFT_1324012 [Mycena alexandri]
MAISHVGHQLAAGDEFIKGKYGEQKCSGFLLHPGPRCPLSPKRDRPCNPTYLPTYLPPSASDSVYTGIIPGTGVPERDRAVILEIQVFVASELVQKFVRGAQVHGRLGRQNGYLVPVLSTPNINKPGPVEKGLPVYLPARSKLRSIAPPEGPKPSKILNKYLLIGGVRFSHTVGYNISSWANYSATNQELCKTSGSLSPRSSHPTLLRDVRIQTNELEYAIRECGGRNHLRQWHPAQRRVESPEDVESLSRTPSASKRSPSKSSFRSLVISS